MLFGNVTIRLCGSDDFPAEAKRQAAAELMAAAASGDLAVPMAGPLPLVRAALADERVEADNRRRVLLESLTNALSARGRIATVQRLLAICENGPS